MLGLWGQRAPADARGPRRAKRKPPAPQSESGTGSDSATVSDSDSDSDSEHPRSVSGSIDSGSESYTSSEADGPRAPPSTHGWSLFGRRPDNTVGSDEDGDTSDATTREESGSDAQSVDCSTDVSSDDSAPETEDESIAVTRSWFGRRVMITSPGDVDESDGQEEYSEADDEPSSSDDDDDVDQTPRQQRATVPSVASRIGRWFGRSPGVAEEDELESDDSGETYASGGDEDEDTSLIPRRPSFALSSWFPRAASATPSLTEEDEGSQEDEGHSEDSSSDGQDDDSFDDGEGTGDDYSSEYDSDDEALTD